MNKSHIVPNKVSTILKTNNKSNNTTNIIEYFISQNIIEYLFLRQVVNQIVQNIT